MTWHEIERQHVACYWAVSQVLALLQCSLGGRDSDAEMEPGSHMILMIAVTRCARYPSDSHANLEGGTE